MLLMTIYKDTTGLFSESECNWDNMVEMEFPEWIVKEYYKSNESAFVKETAWELSIPEEKCTFDRWINEVYTADDTDGLYEFAKERGFTAKCGDNHPCTVFYRDDCNYKYTIFEGTHDECRQFCKENEWDWHGNEMEIKF